MKIIWKNQNKYIRLRIARVGFTYRADISVNKYAFNGNVPCRYYEINFDCFSPYDYVDENEALKNAIEWLKEEASKFQEQLKEVSK